ncbi:MAG: hypothetical protein WA610_03510, partial [Thermodesulfovibrionales bacterium]
LSPSQDFFELAAINLGRAGFHVMRVQCRMVFLGTGYNSHVDPLASLGHRSISQNRRQEMASGDNSYFAFAHIRRVSSRCGIRLLFFYTARACLECI